MIKHTALKISIALGLAVSASNASALVPTVDAAQAAMEVKITIQDLIQRARSMEISKMAMDMSSAVKEMEIDSFNNGVANTVSRINQAYTDIFNLEQMANSTPSKSACGAISYSVSMSEALCSEGNILNGISEKIGMAGDKVSSLAIYQSAKDSVSSITGIDLQAPGGTSGSGAGAASSREASLALQNTKAHIQATVAAVDKMEAWSNAGKADSALNPALLTEIGGTPLVYTDEELEMATTLTRLIYPPFVRSSTQDPINEVDVAQDMRKQNLQELPSMVTAAHLARHAKRDDGLPPKMAALSLPVEIMFDPNGDIDQTGESWMQRLAVDNGGAEALGSKEELLMKGIKLQQMLESYKTSLGLEKIVANRILAKIEPVRD